MILHINGDINRYYVQTLCMIFFPGEKFPEDEEITENMELLFSLLIFYTDKGGLTPGTYKCNPRIKDWKKID